MEYVERERQTSPIEDLYNGDVIMTDCNALFVDELESEQVLIPVPEELQEQYNLPANAGVSVSKKRYTVYQSEFHSDTTVHALVLQKLRQAKETDEFAYRIDSPGGFISEGIKIIAIMKEIFNRRTTTYLDAGAYSMGAVTFSCGDKRVANEYSTLMYHNYSSGTWGKGDDNATSVANSEKQVHYFFKNIIVKKGYLTEDEYARMRDGHDYYMDAEEMAVRGIATHVIAEGVELTAEQYVDYIAMGLSMDEYLAHLENIAEEEEEGIDIETLLNMLGIDYRIEEKDVEESCYEEDFSISTFQREADQLEEEEQEEE